MDVNSKILSTRGRLQCATCHREERKKRKRERERNEQQPEHMTNKSNCSSI